MNVFQTVILAFQSIVQNKMRAGLTMLGMVIGVAAVIALVAAGAGAQAQALARFESMGANVLTITPSQAVSFRGFRPGISVGFSSTPFTNANVETIRELATSVLYLAPQYSGQASVVFGSNSTRTNVIGTTPEYLWVNDFKVAKGRFISQLDQTNRERVVVLSSSLAEDLFSGTLFEPVGQTIKINRESYLVVGVLEDTSGTGFTRVPDVVIPLSTAQLKFGGVGNQDVSSIGVEVVSSSKVAFAKAELTTILRTIRGIQSGQTDNFSIMDPSQVVENIEETTQTFTTLLGSIAAISLIVGGIGIMNIMLVSVTERTREIGIRKAVGAKRRDILFQFLVEAITLSVIGGFVGILVGIAAAQVISPMLGTAQAVVTPESVVLALAVSMGVGIFFGAYPANRASGLHPIEALRYE
ncbi:MAG: ABC transporter permease [Anaerolineae bacterium]